MTSSAHNSHASTPPLEPSPNPAPTSSSPSSERQALAPPRPLLSSFNLEGLVEYIKMNEPKRILVMMGAGASVAAGIPDFRSPGVGLYSKLAVSYPELAEHPESLFDLGAFRENPKLFYKVMNEMGLWPDQYRPTHAHRFVRLLQDKGLLLRCYTQNIDSLERSAGVREELLVEAHGAFASAHCVDCKTSVAIGVVEVCAKRGEVPRCPNAECRGLVKPDVVFFGESLPQRFFELVHNDTEVCDLLLIIGTSLKVYPFAMVPTFISKKVPRVLINMTRAGDRTFVFQTDVDGTSASVAPEESSSSDDDGSDCGSSSSSEGPNATPLPADQLLHCYRDLLLHGDCQMTIQRLVESLGWVLPQE